MGEQRYCRFHACSRRSEQRWCRFHLGAKKFALRHCVIAKARKNSPCALKTPQIWCICACWANFFAERPVDGRCWASFFVLAGAPAGYAHPRAWERILQSLTSTGAKRHEASSWWIGTVPTVSCENAPNVCLWTKSYQKRTILWHTEGRKTSATTGAVRA